jgi:four helix bundle protein
VNCGLQIAECGLKDRFLWLLVFLTHEIRNPHFAIRNPKGLFMTPEDLKLRTKRFALRILKLVDALPTKVSAQTIARQLSKSGTSVAANYRAACRARSPAEFCSKMGVVEEESDESAFWLEMLIDAELVPEAQLRDLLAESGELTAIAVASIRTARKNS